MKIILLASLFALTACGESTQTIIASGSPECVDGLMLTSSQTNCQTGGPAPTPTPAPQTVGLVILADDQSPPPSGYTLQGSARVPQGTPSSWQTFGVNNAAPITKTFSTTMVQVGECRKVDLKVKVTNAPAQHSGTFNNAVDANKFQYCLDGNDVLAKYEDGVDDKFNDYQFRISSTNGLPLDYKIVGTQLWICLN